MGAFGWPHLLLIFAVIVLLFGATKLPTLARSVGQSARAFKGEMKAMREDDTSPAPVAGGSSEPVAPPAPTSAGIGG
ncbi:MAG TPA: Sec-independent protein translocase subunit TatA [Microbacterium sp.]|uniref:Sec-independent protein translocase subunit TatA n=1 Tax=Microbacterium sp. TaxID=51671 RepID=UPI002B48AA67|nr:Sec-independent protein translocase subunit TatA [Microbacterium sp.]HKT57182.1 Sec-independent protein translocase subunit TatA [Microbacterium sp.]